MAPKPGPQSPDALIRQLASGEAAPLYFIHAGERPRRGAGQSGQSPYNDYLLDRLLDAFRRAVVDGNTKDFNYNQFIAPESGMDTVLGVAQTYPMMRKRRLVIVKDAHQFKSADWSRAEGYFPNPSPSTVLVLVGEHLPSGSKGGPKALKLVKDSCVLVSVEPFGRPQDIAPYLAAELQQRGLSLDKRAEAMLMDLLGTDMNEILGALDKLELYAGERRSLNAEDVQRCVSRTRGEELWGFQDALGNRQLGTALPLLGRLLENARPDDEIQLVGALIRHFRGVAEFRRLLDQKIPRNSLLSIVPGSPFANKKRLEQAERHSASSMATLLAELEKLDQGIRSSRVPNATLFERFVMRACRTR